MQDDAANDDLTRLLDLFLALLLLPLFENDDDDGDDDGSGLPSGSELDSLPTSSVASSTTVAIAHFHTLLPGTLCFALASLSLSGHDFCTVLVLFSFVSLVRIYCDPFFLVTHGMIPFF